MLLLVEKLVAVFVLKLVAVFVLKRNVDDENKEIDERVSERVISDV